MQFKHQGLKSCWSKKGFVKEIIFTKLHDSWMNTKHYKNSQFLKNIIALFLGSVNPLLTTKISAFGHALGLCLFEVTQDCQTTIQFLLKNTHTKPPQNPHQHQQKAHHKTNYWVFFLWDNADFITSAITTCL